MNSVTFEERICGSNPVARFNVFFKFDQKVYKQNFSTPMGSSRCHSSLIIADLVIQDLGREGLGKLINYRFTSDT